MIVEIPFWVILYNVTHEGEEIVFPYNNKWYRCDISKVPQDFFKLRQLKLWLEGQYTSNESLQVDLSKKPYIKIDIEECEEIPESYPL